jgi:uncharacterized protein YidB (DUF937 family)
MSERSGFPSMTALLGLIAVAGYQNRDKIAEMLKDFSGGGAAPAGSQNPQGQIAGQSAGPGSGQGGGQTAGQGQLGGLRDILGGASAGGLLTGGLGELMDRLKQSGHQDKAESWVGNGPNKDIAPTDLKTAIGPDVLQTLSRATGLSQDELLSRLSRELPTAVDKYTPDGRLSAA